MNARRRQQSAMKAPASIALVLLAGLLLSARLWAAANACRYTIGADTVMDNVTGLLWQRATQGVNSWSTAVSYCQNLNLGGYSSGWRLPTIHELESIVDNRGDPVRIDVTAFPDTIGQEYWSSTPKAGDPTFKWSIDFGYGSSHPKETVYQGWWRCVR